MTIQEISTHKAVKENGKISIIEKGLDPKKWLIDFPEDEEFIKENPDMFKERVCYTIPLNHEDDVLSIMERYEENNRCNLNGY